MNTRTKKQLAVLMSGIMLAGAVLPYDAGNTLAASKPKLSKKSVVIRKGKQAKVSLKKKAGATKIKWSIGSKKTASIKAKKASVTITGKRAGQTKLTCRFRLRGKTKKLTCKVIVKEGTSALQTPAPTENNGQGSTVQPPVYTNVPDNPGNTTAPPQPPVESQKPDSSAEPDKTQNPEESGKPDSSEPPVTSENPKESGAPDVSQKPNTSQSPETSKKPVASPSQVPSMVPMGAPSVVPSSSPSPTPEPAKEGVFLDSDYADGSTGGMKGRGSAAVKAVQDADIAVIPVLSVTGRTNTWNGAAIDASGLLKPGSIYTINTAVYQKAVASTEIYLTLSYKDSAGETQYQRIATAAAVKNQWTGIQADISVPDGVTEPCVYFEEKATNDFYVAPVQIFDKDKYDKTALDDFETSTLTNFKARGAATIGTADGGVMGKCLKVSERKEAWNGVSSAVSIKPGSSVYVTGYVKTEAEGYTFKVSAQGKDASGKDTYPGLLKMELNAGEWTKFQCVKTFTKEDFMSLDFVYFEMEDNGTGVQPDFYLDNVSICAVNPPSDGSELDAEASYDITGSLLDAYKPFFGNVGTCMNASQLNGETTLAFAKSQYNSVTPENETKPDSMLNRGTMPVSQAKSNKYYYVPDNYQESTCPNINYSQLDAYMKKAAENGMRIRFHVFVWHQQTPKWFFKENYKADGEFVDAETMDARMELYIKSVIRYITLKEQELGYGDVIYCYDVVNEYFHNNNNQENGTPYKAYWDEVYYPDKVFDVNNPNDYKQTTEPTYVKKAFTYAREILDSYNKSNITLFYNDFNTYIGDTPDNIIAMMKYINKEKTLCDGIGMQSHLDVGYPSPEGYTQAMKKFLDCSAIKEVQITELDVTAYESKNATLDTQMTYYYNLLKGVLALQKSYPNKMTGLTFWGLYDGVSWRKDGKPLLFTSTSKAKGVYFKVLQAAEEALKS